MPSIVAAGYEPFFKKYEQLLTVEQFETGKRITQNTNKQQKEASLEAERLFNLD